MRDEPRSPCEEGVTGIAGIRCMVSECAVLGAYCIEHFNFIESIGIGGDWWPFLEDYNSMSTYCGFQ